MPDSVVRRDVKVDTRYFEIAKKSYSKETFEEIIGKGGEWKSDGELIGRLENGDKYYVLTSPHGYGWADLVFEKKDDNSYGITKAGYEFLFGRSLNPKEDLRKIREKIAKSNFLPTILNSDELMKLKWIEELV